MNMLSVKNLYYRVTIKPGEEVVILNNITFDLNEGTILGITGESGAGKTTLARIIAGQLTPSDGKIVLNLSGNGKGNNVQLLFQNTGDIINPFRKVYEVISEAAEIRLKNKKAADREAAEILKLLKLEDTVWHNRGYELSGGQQQRAALARLLAVHPKLLILDEPFAAQDIESQVNLLNLLLEIKRQFNLTIICISHNLKILRKFADRIIILKEGSVIEEGNTREVFSSPSHPYTKLLMRAEEYNLSSEEKSLLKDTPPDK
jgi:ABC-type dipeptide/oligopeptide/nickel transport system ATPase subunit